jgi:hypothetical protein
MPWRNAQKQAAVAPTEAARLNVQGVKGAARPLHSQTMNQWGAKFGSPAIFVSLVEWADRIIVE